MRLILLWVLCLLAACAPETDPTGRVVLRDEQATYDFRTGAEGWQLFTAPQGRAVFRHDADAEALEGAVLANLGHIVSLVAGRYANTVVEATLQQQRGRLSASMGVVCRADDDGNGYYFLISQQGNFSIQKGNATQSDLIPLLPWGPSDAIRTADDFAANDIVAVCSSAYLALFINGQFAGDVRDDEFTVGQVGVAIAGPGDSDTATWGTWDDITITEGLYAGPR